MRRTSTNTTNRDPRVSNVDQRPVRVSTLNVLALGILLGVAATVAVTETVGRRNDPLTDHDIVSDRIESVEDVFTVPESVLARLDFTELDWLVSHSLLDAPPSRQAGGKTLRRWVSEIRAVAPVMPHSTDLITAEMMQDRWRMILGALGERVGVTYDLTPPVAARAEDQWLTAALASRRVTTATMPLLILAIGQALGDPIAPLPAGERLLSRVTLRTGASFNLDVDRHGLQTPDDRGLMTANHIPIRAVENKSELAPLSNRELAAWLMARRARVLRHRGRFADAERDLLLARSVMPANRSMFLQMAQLIERRGPEVLGQSAWAALRMNSNPAAPGIGMPSRPDDVMAFNRRNRNSNAGIPGIEPPTVPGFGAGHTPGLPGGGAR